MVGGRSDPVHCVLISTSRLNSMAVKPQHAITPPVGLNLLPPRLESIW